MPCVPMGWLSLWQAAWGAATTSHRPVLALSCTAPPWAGWRAAAWLLEGTGTLPSAIHLQERLWKRAAAKALADAAAAAALRGGLRATSAGADVRGGAAAAKVRAVPTLSRSGRHPCTAWECAMAEERPQCPSWVRWALRARRARGSQGPVLCPAVGLRWPARMRVA